MRRDLLPAVAVTLALLSACGDSAETSVRQEAPVAPASSTTTAAPVETSTTTTAPGPRNATFPKNATPLPGGVRLTLTLASTQARSGGSFSGVLVLRNDSADPIVRTDDPCSNGRLALYLDGALVTGDTVCATYLGPEYTVGPGEERRWDVSVDAVGQGSQGRRKELAPGTYDAFGGISAPRGGVWYSGAVRVRVVPASSG